MTSPYYFVKGGRMAVYGQMKVQKFSVSQKRPGQITNVTKTEPVESSSF